MKLLFSAKIETTINKLNSAQPGSSKQPEKSDYEAKM